MDKCPHCQNASFSFLRKFSIGPITIIKCPSCGKKIGVSSAAWLGFVSAGIGIFLGFLSTSLTMRFIFILLGFSLCGFIYLYFVSLVRK